MNPKTRVIKGQIARLVHARFTRFLRLDIVAVLIKRRLIDPYFPDSQHRKAKVFYSQFAGAGDLAFDVGAYFGSRTQVFLELGARVVVVEPERRCLRFLKIAYGKNANVIIIPKAISDHNGQAKLMICENNPVASSVSEKWITEGRFRGGYRNFEIVPTTTLDDLIADYGLPSFCKIDIEGHELAALRGLTKSIPSLSFEFAKEFIDDVWRCLNELLRIDACYKFNCSIGETFELLFPTWVTHEELLRKLHQMDDGAWGDIYAQLL